MSAVAWMLQCGQRDQNWTIPQFLIKRRGTKSFFFLLLTGCFGLFKGAVAAWVLGSIRFEFPCSLCVCVGFLPVLRFLPQSKTCRVDIKSGPSSKWSDEDLDLISGPCTAAAHCCSEEDGSRAENSSSSSSCPCQTFSTGLFSHICKKNLKGTRRPDKDEACSAAENQGGLHTDEELKNNKQNDRLIIS